MSINLNLVEIIYVTLTGTGWIFTNENKEIRMRTFYGGSKKGDSLKFKEQEQWLFLKLNAL